MARRGRQRLPLNDEQARLLRGELLGFLAHRAGDPVLAEDLTQEALARVVAGLSEFRGDSALSTWARRIAYNVWHDHLRRQRAKPAERGAGNEELWVTAVLDSLDPSTPEAARDRQTTRECLLDAVKHLPLGERSVVLLHDLGDVPLDQVAATLGCTVGAARQRLHRGRQRLAGICRSECSHDTADDGSALCSRKAPTDANEAPAPARAHRRER
jgi:RNA polymerase sigma-70 factor (ECF subfamily)